MQKCLQATAMVFALGVLIQGGAVYAEPPPGPAGSAPCGEVSTGQRLACAFAAGYGGFKVAKWVASGWRAIFGSSSSSAGAAAGGDDGLALGAGAASGVGTLTTDYCACAWQAWEDWLASCPYCIFPGGYPGGHPGYGS